MNSKKMLLGNEKYKDVKILAITDRKNCKTDFLEQVEKIARLRPYGIILREKDLSVKEYLSLAAGVNEICKTYNTPLIIHNFVNAALELGIKRIHLPLNVLTATDKSLIREFETVGASTHSLKDAILAKEHGATYITAGHIFETSCKKGLKGRGIEFLEEMVQKNNLPVYAIGGIGVNNIDSVLATKCEGACVMSETNAV